MASSEVRSRDAERGQVIVLFALSLVVMLGVVALILDGGRVYTTRRQAQNAADAAANAGASALDASSSPASIVATLNAVQTAACRAAGLNGFGSGTLDATCGPNGSVVRIHVPSSSDGASTLPGVLAAFETPGYVQVSVTSTWTPWIAGVLGLNTFTASALAVAVNIPGHGVGYTLLVLDPTDCGSLVLNDTQAYIHGGGVLVDSDAAKTGDVACTNKNAAVLNGNGSLLQTDASTGSNNVVGQGDNYAGSSQVAVPLWTTGADYQVDPLAGVHVPLRSDTSAWTSVPNQPGSEFNPKTWNNCVSCANKFPDPSTGLAPGVIWGGINVGNGDHLVLQGGTYIMAGGGFNVQNGGDVSARNPVTIIITQDASCNSANPGSCQGPGKGYGDMPSGSSGTGQTGGSWGDPSTNTGQYQYGPLTAQTNASQSYLNGILLYIDRDVGLCSGSGNTTLNVGGGGSFFFNTGSIVYAPCSTVKLFGNNVSYGGAVVAWNVSLNGSGKTLNLGGPGVPIGSPSKTNLVQ